MHGGGIDLLDDAHLPASAGPARRLDRAPVARDGAKIRGLDAEIHRPAGDHRSEEVVDLRQVADALAAVETEVEAQRIGDDGAQLAGDGPPVDVLRADDDRLGDVEGAQDQRLFRGGVFWT